MTLVRAAGFLYFRRTMNVGLYRLNLDALLARIIYRWRGRAVAAIALLLALLAVGTGALRPFWRGRAALAISAAPDASVFVDGQSWPRPIYAGQHMLTATLPDGRSAWANVDLQAGSALTVTLPTGLPSPRERALPPAAPGSEIAQVWWADGAWRVLSTPIEAHIENAETGQPTTAPAPGQTVAVRASSVERLAMLDAYTGLADQVHRDGRLVEAIYRPQEQRGLSDQALGTIEVRGWGQVAQTIPISTPLTLLRFSPDGAALLEAERLPGGSTQLYRITSDLARVPVMAVPGRIARLSWRPDSRAVTVHSLQGERLTLTLLRLAPTVLAATIADLLAASYAASLVPLAWDDAGLLWVAPDADGRSTLWSAPLKSLLPEPRGPFEARALTVLLDGALRVLTVQDERLEIGRFQAGIFIGETSVPGVPTAPDLIGEWQGDELLVQGGGRAWLLDLSERGQ